MSCKINKLPANFCAMELTLDTEDFTQKTRERWERVSPMVIQEAKNQTVKTTKNTTDSHLRTWNQWLSETKRGEIVRT